jgi:hypothetical protein
MRLLWQRNNKMTINSTGVMLFKMLHDGLFLRGELSMVRCVLQNFLSRSSLLAMVVWFNSTVR